MTSQVPMPRRVAVVNITEQMIASMLDLPEGVRVIGVRDNFLTMSVHVMLEGDALPERDPSTYPVQLGVAWDHGAVKGLRFRVLLPEPPPAP